MKGFDTRFLKRYLIGLIVSFGLLTPSFGGDLWKQVTSQPEQRQKKQVKLNSPYEPQVRTFKKHDLVTVIVEESVSASSSSSYDSTQESEMETEIAEFLRLSSDDDDIDGDGFRLKEGLVGENPAIELESALETEGEGNLERSSNITATVTAKVVQKLPNGNLVIEANDRRKINDETEKVSLTATVRPDDISPNNTVRSRFLADLNVRVTGSGSVTDPTKRGIFSKIMQIIWPF